MISVSEEACSIKSEVLLHAFSNVSEIAPPAGAIETPEAAQMLRSGVETPSARVHDLTGGVPRTIRLVCQHSLDVAHHSGESSITPEIVDRGFAELSLRGAEAVGGE